MVDDVLDKYGKLVVSQLRDAIKNKPLPRNGGKSYVANASGNLEKTLTYNVDNGVLTVSANRYIGSLIFGRKPTTGGGKGVLKAKIRQWIDDKGIVPHDNISKDSLAFLITRKIHREGNSLYPNGSDLLSAIVTDKLISDIKNEIFLEFTDVVKTGFETIKKAA